MQVVLFLFTFGLIWKWYTYSKYIGLYLSVITLFVLTLMPFVNHYKSPTMIKFTLVVFTSMCVFTGILFQCTREFINQFLTWLIRINIGMLVFAIHILPVKVLLLLSAITTPYMLTSDTGVMLRSALIHKDLWVVLTGVCIMLFYTYDVDFANSPSFPLCLLAIFIPTLFHFINNHYWESRFILLCLAIIYDVVYRNPNVFSLFLNGL